MLVLILFLFVICFAGFCLQSSFLNKKLVIVYAIISSLFIYFSHEYVINESFSSIRKMLENQNLMYSFSIIVTIESIFGILTNLSILKKSKSDKFYLLKYVPSVSWFLTLYVLEVFVFLNIAGMNFVVLASAVAIATALVYLLLVTFFKNEKEKEFAFNLKVAIHIIQIILSSIITVIYTVKPYSAAHQDYGVLPLVVVIASALPIIVIGFFYNKLRLIKLANKF